MPTDDEIAEGLKPFNDRGPTDEDLIALHDRTVNMGSTILQILERCDLLAISDGADYPIEIAGRPAGSTGKYRYAVAFAARDGSVMDYVQGDDLPALLEEVLKRVS